MKSTNGNKRRWWILGVLTFSFLIIGFDATILSVALPVLAADLQASTTDLQWITNAYLLVLAALLLPAGSFGDRYGRKKLLLLGLVIFGITSAMAGYASDLNVLIAARALMGIGAAIITPLTLSILPTVFPVEERGKAIGIWAAGAGIGLLIGPLLGGWLLEHYVWGSVFLINLPLIALVIVAALFLVPESKAPDSPRMDWLGMILSGLGFSLLIYGLIEGARKSWTDAEIIGTLAGGGVLLILFVLWQLKTKHPLLHMDLFKSRDFTWGTVAGCFVMFSLSGLLFFVTQYIQFVLGNSPLDTGIKLMPLIGAYVVGAIFSDVLATRLGRKWIVSGGLFILAIGFYLLSIVDVNSAYLFVTLCLIIQGLGMSLAMAPAMDAVMGSLPLAQAGVGSAVNNTLRQVCSTLGIAVLGSALSTGYSRSMRGVEGLPAEINEIASLSIGTARQVALQIESPIREQLVMKADQAFIDGMSAALLFGAAMLIVGTIITVIFLPSRTGKA